MALLAAPLVGPEGRVVGIDITPGMVEQVPKRFLVLSTHMSSHWRQGTGWKLCKPGGRLGQMKGLHGSQQPCAVQRLSLW